MKKIIFIISILCCITLTHAQAIYSINNGLIIPSSSFIDPFDDTVFENIAPFKEKGKVNIAVGKYNYSVDIMRYQDWEAEGGSFEIINIKCDDTEILQLKNSESWDNIYSNLTKYANNPYFITIPIDSTSKALLFMGFSRSSEPSYVTIIVLKEGKATMVYNKKVFIYGINDTNGFLIGLKNTGEDINNHVDFQIKKYTIWVSGAVLRYRVD